MAPNCDIESINVAHGYKHFEKSVEPGQSVPFASAKSDATANTVRSSTYWKTSALDRN